MIINCSEKYLRIVMTEEDKNGNLNFKKKIANFFKMCGQWCPSLK